jgi:uncharacterized protein DUF6744
MMREIIDGMNAVSLREAGGVYFVPANEHDSLLRLRQLIASIPKVAELDPFVCALGVPDAVEAKRGLSKAVHAGLLDEISSLQTDLSRLSESGDRLREKTIAKRLIVYKRLKAKAEMYQELLGNATGRGAGQHRRVGTGCAHPSRCGCRSYHHLNFSTSRIAHRQI